MKTHYNATMQKFANAYSYCYGTSVKFAKEVYKSASEQFIKAVIESYENDSRNSWFED